MTIVMLARNICKYITIKYKLSVNKKYDVVTQSRITRKMLSN